MFVVQSDKHTNLHGFSKIVCAFRDQYTRGTCVARLSCSYLVCTICENATASRKTLQAHFTLCIQQVDTLLTTVDGKRFAGLNTHGFSIIKVFAKIFSCCLDHKYSLFSIIKEKHLYSRKNFRGTPKNREKREYLA